MKNGLLVCYKDSEKGSVYKYIDTKEYVAEIQKDYEIMEMYIVVQGKKAMVIPYKNVTDGLFIYLENGTPTRTIEFSYDGDRYKHYEDRKATFEDSIVSNYLLMNNKMKEYM